MKVFKKFILIGLTLTVLVATKLNKEKASTNFENSLDVVGVASNIPGNSDTASVAYALGKTQHFLPEQVSTGFKAPEMVDHLTESIPLPPPGPVETVDEIPTQKAYYDGENKLNVVNVRCEVFNIPTLCYKSGACGWCGSLSACVAGNAAGPIGSCAKGYLFAPNPLNQLAPPNLGGLNVQLPLSS